MASRIVICGLGPGSWDALPLGVLARLRRGGLIFLRTEKHPLVPRLREEGISFTSFDSFYEEEESFPTVYRRIAETLLEAAKREGEVVYAVPGHPLVAEEPSRLLLKHAPKQGVELEILPAPSFLDALLVTLNLSPDEGLMVLDALDPEFSARISPSLPTVVMQTYSRLVASEVKVFLLESYPPEHPVTWVRAAGVPGEERKETLPLSLLDRMPFDHLTSIYLPPLATSFKPRFSLAPLAQVLAELRGEKGCPWDKEQTHQSLKKYLLEETYEVLEAIDRVEEDPHNLCEELGDLLLQIVFHCQIAAEAGRFNLDDVVRSITRKMIARHPHVFGEEEVAGGALGVIRNWERIKQKEKKERASLMDGLGSRNLPALLRAAACQRRAARVGFDWKDWRGAADKVREELEEIERQVASHPNPKDLALEVGDLLFAAVNVARLLGVEAEEALHRSVDKFVERFRYLEERAKASGVKLEEAGIELLDTFWEEAKKKVKKSP
ncbi:MazG family protein [Ammonifex degensii KC4]|uniref:MazG family protein n=1 Tax=Ammonifex degensii (strain DSM 10501 / KC4) TaxID=429009 RepID=C9RA19_AMMDK|nr:nucleoside triphosphate pyrophosphohydrolase [Ammonifex degensii]ACX53148.1 MazG family protein [Ammonifex degensii KC4]